MVLSVHMLDYLSLMDFRIAVPLGGNLKSISVALNFKVAYGGKHPYNYVHQFFQEASRSEKKYPCIHVFLSRFHKIQVL